MLSPSSPETLQEMTYNFQKAKSLQTGVVPAKPWHAEDHSKHICPKSHLRGGVKSR